MKGKYWVSIRSDRKKGLSYTEISKKYCIGLSIKIESYLLKGRKEMMKSKKIINTLFEKQE